MKLLSAVGVGTMGLLLLAGCKKTADNSANYKSAIDGWYSAHPSCLWSAPKKFPVQVGASDDSENAPYAALVDKGLLVRSTSEKRIIIVSKQEINYDLSDNGRSAWTADANDPGYGNFCYGHRTAQSITSSTPNKAQPGATTTVNYTYGFTGAPEWAKSAEVENAFPQVKSDLTGNGSAVATLTDTSNGWQVTTAPPSNGYGPNTTPADGQIAR
jgi:hypothetical protein